MVLNINLERALERRVVRSSRKKNVTKNNGIGREALKETIRDEAQINYKENQEVT